MTMLPAVQRVISAYYQLLPEHSKRGLCVDPFDTKPAIAEDREVNSRGDNTLEDLPLGYTTAIESRTECPFIHGKETVALVGRIASGKSTVLNILLRLRIRRRGDFCQAVTAVGLLQHLDRAPTGVQALTVLSLSVGLKLKEDAAS